MATYNWSTVLPFSIASVIEQTFTDFELLVVGDACTDDSERVVAEIGDPRVRWINLPTRSGHQSGPNNEGIRQARGEFIAYLGHDDLWLPRHLEAMVTALASADLAHSIVAVVSPNGHVAPWTLAPSGVAHRRTLPDRIGNWRNYRELVFAPDVDLWDRALAAGAAFAYVPRLTAIKFPASLRPDVYRERPCHEQQAWLARIRTEPELEATLLAKMVALRQLKPQSFAMRFARLLIRPWRWPAALWRRMPGQKGAAIRRTRRFKGVVDA